MDGFNLAQTCNACATEFAHQKAQKIWEELALTVTRDPPIESSCYGTELDPVSLHVKWEKNPGSALRRFYAISQRPDCVEFMNELWRQAWPKTLWADVLRDGLSWGWPDVQSTAQNEADRNEICINVQVQLSSDEPLQLPWDWLAKTLLYAPAAGLRAHLIASAPQQMQEDLLKQFDALLSFNDSERPARMRIEISSHRPAQSDELQEIMYQNLYCFPASDVYYGDTRHGWVYVEDEPESALSWPLARVRCEWYIKPSCQSKVAITGSWCQAHPDASVALMYARDSLTDRYMPDSPGVNMTSGDDMIVNLKDSAEQLEDLWWAHFRCHVHDVTVGEPAIHLDHCLHYFSHGFLLMLGSCEVADQSDWKMKRQQAKQRGRVKNERAKAAWRQKQVRMRKSSKAIKNNISESVFEDLVAF